MKRPVLPPHKVTSGYGPRVLNCNEQFHNGIDYINRNDDRRVVCMESGIVVYDKDNYDHSLRWQTAEDSAGNMIILKSTIDGVPYFIRYLHLVSNSVSYGDTIEEGQIVGEYGDVGYSFGAHTHIDFWTIGWVNINPTQLILSNLS